MVFSDLHIWNLALSFLAIGKEVASTTERSPEAECLKRLYDTSILTTLSDGDWPFARRFKSLALLEENPTSEWVYSFRLPVNCLNVKRIITGVKSDTLSGRVPFIQGSDDVGGLLYCDILNSDGECEIEYTASITDTKYFSPTFVLASAFKLAALAAPRLTGGDANKLGANAEAKYLRHIDMSKAQAYNAEQAGIPADPESIRERNR